MTITHLMNGVKIIAIFITALPAVLFAGEFYKWTDENGTVHYSQRAPENAKAETMRTYNSRNSGPQSTLSGTEALEPENKEDSSSQEETAEVELAKKDPELCKRAKKDSDTLRSRPMVRQNGKVMTMKQKNQQIKQLQDVISVHC
jgi:hypothetical protein